MEMIKLSRKENLRISNDLEYYLKPIKDQMDDIKNNFLKSDKKEQNKQGRRGSHQAGLDISKKNGLLDKIMMPGNEQSKMDKEGLEKILKVMRQQKKETMGKLDDLEKKLENIFRLHF